MFDPKSCTASTQTTVGLLSEEEVGSLLSKTSSPQREDGRIGNTFEAAGKGKTQSKGKGTGKERQTNSEARAINTTLSQGKGKNKVGFTDGEPNRGQRDAYRDGLWS